MRAAAVVTALVLLAGTASADTLFVGVGNGSSVNAGGVLIADPLTGAGALLGDPVTPGGLAGLDFDASDRLYGSTIQGFGSTSALVEIDPLDGALLSTVGSVVDSIDNLPLSIGDLAFDPISESLYGIRSGSDGQARAGELYTIDTLTGIATFVGDTDIASAGGLAFAPDGTLYFVAVDNTFSNLLTTVDPSNGAILTSVSLSKYFDGLGVRADGTIFATANGGSNDEIWTLATTGVASLVGHTGAGSGSDLTFTAATITVPEPATGWLLTFALAGALALRPRRS